MEKNNISKEIKSVLTEVYDNFIALKEVVTNDTSKENILKFINTINTLHGKLKKANPIIAEYSVYANNRGFKSNADDEKVLALLLNIKSISSKNLASNAHTFIKTSLKLIIINNIDIELLKNFIFAAIKYQALPEAKIILDYDDIDYICKSITNHDAKKQIFDSISLLNLVKALDYSMVEEKESMSFDDKLQKDFNELGLDIKVN